MSSPSQPRTYYTLLGITQDASPKEIEKAYKRQALIHHPDRNPNDSQTQSTNKFQKLAEAYEVLRDPVKRRKYDVKVANTIALNSESGATPARPPSSANVYPNRPASQQSARPTNQPKRASTFDLFAYPGETPKYVPTPSRRPASAVPSFRPRPDPAAQPPPSSMPSSTTTNTPNPTLLKPRHSLASYQANKSAQRPFTQKINLKDLDSLDFILNLGLHPQDQPHLSRSSAPRAPACNPTVESSFHPTNSRDMSTSAPDPYLTFERAWGQSLDEIVDGVADRETSHGRYSNRKSHTDPNLRPRNVQRSATVRSADSDYRASSFDDYHAQRRPRSAGSDAFRDWLPSPNCTSPTPVSTRPSKESHLALDDDRFYLPSAAYHPSQTRRMSTGNGKLYQPAPSSHHHHHQQQQQHNRLYQQASNPGGIARAATGPSIRGHGVRGGGTSSANTSPSSSSPTDYPLSSHAHGFAPNGRRSRATTMMPEYPLDGEKASCGNHGGLSQEFREVIIRFERERDGSTRMSKEMKSRTIDLDGTVHDRYRRQRAAAVN